MNEKIKLYTPGPLSYYPWVKEAMDTTVHHRSQEFHELFQETRDGLYQILHDDSQEGRLVFFSSSGTGGLNAALQNTVKKGGRLAVIDNGAFGHRVAGIADFYGWKMDHIEVPMGYPIPNDLEVPNADVYFMVYVETSTGTLSNVEQFISHVKEQNPHALIIVDAISAIGAYNIVPLRTSVDVLIGASHKVFAAPPGISFVWVGPNVRLQKTIDFYFDIRAEYEFQSRHDEFRYTPPVEVFSALHASVSRVASDPRQFIDMHKRRQRIFAKALESHELQLFSKNPATVVSAVRVRDSFKVKRFVKGHGYQIAQGYGESKEDVVRVSHMGAVEENDLRIIAKLIRESGYG